MQTRTPGELLEAIRFETPPPVPMRDPDEDEENGDEDESEDEDGDQEEMPLDPSESAAPLRTRLYDRRDMEARRNRRS